MTRRTSDSANWGGSRPNSGIRPKDPEAGTRTKVHVSLTPANYKFVLDHIQGTESRADALNRLLDQLRTQEGAQSR
jgi:hypothetical protein